MLRSPFRVPPARGRSVLALLSLAWAATGCAQERVVTCPTDLESWIDSGWVSYRSGLIEEAGERFADVLYCDPSSVAGRTGSGYVAMREGRDEAAGKTFAELIDEKPESVDVLVGGGIVAWRMDDLARARELLTRALELQPGHSEASDLLARVEASGAVPTGADGVGVDISVNRPAYVRPDTVQYPARTRGNGFQVRAAGGWEPFYIRGMNLGAALPGQHASQFPPESVYVKWIAQMAELGVNAVRLYTIHPPGLYDAIARHNRANPRRPIWLIHGVWTELPPEDDYLDWEWESGFFAEMRRVVDVIHGRADIPHRPGHAAGSYTSDVSRWTLAFIIGREWEPFSVQGFDRRYAGADRWEGRYLHVDGENAMDAWLTRALDQMVAYEMDAYHAQRPMAYTNWPTLDPLEHPTETTVDQEMAFRVAMGEKVVIGLSTHLVRATREFPAGYFASYHAYPYYPDFMMLDPAYGQAQSPFGASTYFGYLEALKRLHPDMPVVIAEYGVPASLGIAHLQPQGWHHGGHDEAAMAEVNARLTREIAEADMAGGVLFAWIDEWFKKNWIVIEFEIPLDRNRLWLNRLDAEQHYGMIAMEPGEILPGASLRERLPAWREVPPLYAPADGGALRAASDEAYLWLLFERPEVPATVEEVLIGFDLIDPEGGNLRWPERAGPRVPVGLEFVLRLADGEARLLADPRSNPFRLYPVRQDLGSEAPRRPAVFGELDGLPGLFDGRVEGDFRRPYTTRRVKDGRYDSLRVVTNRPRFARDGSEFPALGYDRGVLPHGGPPDGLWEELEDEGVIEVRIPWMLLNFTDPSQRRLLQDPPDADDSDPFGTLTVEDIRIVAAFRDGEQEWTAWPGPKAALAGIDGAGGATAGTVARYSWPTWESPSWRERRRPVFDAMRRVFAELASRAVATGDDR
jgi:hypothetical protein